MKQTKFKISIADPEPLKKSVSVLKNFNSEYLIKIDKTKMQFINMDPSNCVMGTLDILSSGCMEYDVKEPFSFGLNIGNLSDILKNLKKHDVLTVESIDNSEKIKLIFNNRSKREYTLIKIDLEDNASTREPNNLSFDGYVVMDSRLFSDQIKEASTIAESVYFELQSDKFNLTGESDLNTLTIKNRANDELKIKCSSIQKSKYSIEFLKALIDGYRVSDYINLQFKTDYPLRALYTLPNVLQLRFLVAPKVEND